MLYKIDDGCLMDDGQLKERFYMVVGVRFRVTNMHKMRMMGGAHSSHSNRDVCTTNKDRKGGLID